MQKLWTDSEVKKIKTYYEKATVKETAKHFKITDGQLRYVLYSYEYKSPVIKANAVKIANTPIQKPKEPALENKSLLDKFFQLIKDLRS
tara:strand:- start:802 stop:1068 length:267 start_codon:yes stop_codon:yes gene_type:complete